ncbi:MAG: hypothetical protein R6V75_09700 [Bacteroidales bacterium]
MSVVIPAYKEDAILSSIRSLLACDPPGVRWEILVHVNYPENADERAIKVSIRSDGEVRDFAAGLTGRGDVRIHSILSPGLPARHAGVGLARKIGMDAVAGRFAQVGRPDGVVVAFDADSTCSDNYLREITGFYQKNRAARAANLYFEHPLDPDENGQPPLPIIEYELYLRYFRLALEMTGHPHAIHTVGSSFTVRADTYARVGGMGRHKAGEDFYFLHKCLPLGHFYEINTVSVYPSARESDRVIFGTGAAIRKQMQTGGGLDVYGLDSFTPLKELFSRATDYFDEPDGFAADCRRWSERFPALSTFLLEQDAARQIDRMIRDSASAGTFVDKFFAWFNAFRVLRYLNQANGSHNHKKPVTEEAGRLARSLGIPVVNDPVDLLRAFRLMDRDRGIRRII